MLGTARKVPSKGLEHFREVSYCSYILQGATSSLQHPTLTTSSWKCQRNGNEGKHLLTMTKQLVGVLKPVSTTPAQQQSLDTGTLMWFRAWNFAADDGAQGDPGWKGSQEVSVSTSRSKQGQLRYHTRWFCPFRS